MRADACTAPLGPADRALVEHARRLTLSPAAPSAEGVAALRAAGFDDAAILAATEVIGYFNYVNRMAEGLGVELEP